MTGIDPLNLAHKIAPAVLASVLDEHARSESVAEWISAVNFAAGFDTTDMGEDEQIGLLFGSRLYVIAHSASQAFKRTADDMERTAPRRKGEAA